MGGGGEGDVPSDDVLLPFALVDVFEVDGIEVFEVDVFELDGIVLLVGVVVVMGGEGLVARDVVLVLVDSLEVLLSPDATVAAIRGGVVVSAASR